MRNKDLGIVSSICFVVTVIWLALFIYWIARTGPVETQEQALNLIAEPNLLFTLTYVNATFVTLSATMLFAGLHVYLRSQAPLWTAMGIIFVPVYSLLNLLTYVSQITIVPRLVLLRPESDLLVVHMVQQWPGSAISVLNNLAYALLGIPSIIFGWLLAQRQSEQWAGILLGLNGVACILGLVGIAVGSELLGLGSIIGGVLFLAALIPLSRSLLRERQ